MRKKTNHQGGASGMPVKEGGYVRHLANQAVGEINMRERRSFLCCFMIWLSGFGFDRQIDMYIFFAAERCAFALTTVYLDSFHCKTP